MRITIKGLINEGLPPANNFYPRKEKEKRKEEKKGYTLQAAREAAAVKVFCQNTTRSETRCGDCDKNP